MSDTKEKSSMTRQLVMVFGCALGLVLGVGSAAGSLPVELTDTTGGTKFLGCHTRPETGGGTGCSITCDNGFTGACGSGNAAGGWYCYWTNADGTTGSGGGTGASPCTW